MLWTTKHKENIFFKHSKISPVSLRDSQEQPLFFCLPETPSFLGKIRFSFPYATAFFLLLPSNGHQCHPSTSCTKHSYPKGWSVPPFEGKATAPFPALSVTTSKKQLRDWTQCKQKKNEVKWNCVQGKKQHHQPHTHHPTPDLWCSCIYTV